MFISSVLPYFLPVCGLVLALVADLVVRRWPGGGGIVGLYM